MSTTNMTRTDLHCTECGKTFVAQLDLAVDGNHIIECPHCGHEHCRVITKGKVTGERWSSRAQRVNVEKRCVWKSDSMPVLTTTAAAYMRELWLKRTDLVM